MQKILPTLLVARALLFLVVLAGIYFLNVFFIPTLAALVIGFASWPVYQRVVYYLGGRTTLAASLAIFLVVLLLVIPIGLALSYAIQEAGNFVSWALLANKHGMEVPQWIIALPVIGDKLTEYWRIFLGRPHVLGDLVKLISGEHLGDIYRMLISATGNVFHLLMAVLFMLVTLFSIYKDGSYVIQQLDVLGERILPDRWTRLSRVVPATISATINGMGLIAMGEGVILGMAYWITNVPFPILLGIVTSFMALIPGGAPLSFTLVSLYLIGSGCTASGIGLFMWGSIELLIVDKSLRPWLVGGPVKLPFLPTFFGLVGGIKTMGIIGLFVGPVLMALLVGMWREWVRNTQKEQKILHIKNRSMPRKQ